MQPEAIVYTSAAGHTARYAAMLGQKTGLRVLPLEEAVKALDKGCAVIYMGWLFAGSVKGYSKAAKRFDIRAVVGVGLCSTGALLSEVRRTARIPADCPLFTVQGGMERSKLEGMNKKMIDTLTRFMAAKKNKTPDDEEMLRLLTTDGDYVSEENLEAVLRWYGSR